MNYWTELSKKNGWQGIQKSSREGKLYTPHSEDPNRHCLPLEAEFTSTHGLTTQMLNNIPTRPSPVPRNIHCLLAPESELKVTRIPLWDYGQWLVIRIILVEEHIFLGNTFGRQQVKCQRYSRKERGKEIQPLEICKGFDPHAMKTQMAFAASLGTRWLRRRHSLIWVWFSAGLQKSEVRRDILLSLLFHVLI